MILGVDVHIGYDAVRPIDWEAVAAAGVRFAIPKGTLGNEPKGDDQAFRRNVEGAKAAGLLVGFYHFAFPLRSGEGKPAGRSPKEQAERAFAVSRGLGGSAGELPPALDIEWPPHYERADKRDPTSALVDLWSQWEVNAESVAQWTIEYLEHAERLWGRVPLVYTYPDFWRSLGPFGRLPTFARYPLWIATYPKSCATAWLPPDGAGPIVPAPWTDWTIWQFAADGSSVRIPGISACPIDRNVFGGTEEALRRLAGIGADPPTSPAFPAFDVVHPAVPLGDEEPDT